MPKADARADQRRHRRSLTEAELKTDGRDTNRTDPRSIAATVRGAKEKNPLTTAVNGFREVERKGVEPSTSALRTQRSPN
jgi:hypothetical protein